MAVADYFLKIDGIEGESQDSKHQSEIEIESFSVGAVNDGSFALNKGGGTGKVSMKDFHFVMHSNKATPKLLEACATGKHIPKAVLTCRKAGTDQQEYLKVTLSDVLVSSFVLAGHGNGSVLPSDQISMNYAKIEFEYKEQKADGTLGGAVKAGWNLKENKKI